MVYFRSMLIFEVSEIIFFTSLVTATLFLVTRTFPILLKGKQKKQQIFPPLSVVIAAHNEELNLERNLPEIISQDYPDYEIIIVLDRCSDNSKNIVERYADEYSFIRFMEINHIPEGYNPKKFALTQAINHSNTNWIVLTDADCDPGEGWLRSIGCLVDDETDFILGYGPYVRSKSLLNHFIRYETFMTGSDYLSSAMINFPYMGVGRNLIYRKSVFIENGYGEFRKITGGDDDLFVQYNATGKRTKSMIGRNTLTFSQPESSIVSYLKQKRRHYSVGKYYKDGSKLKHSVKYFFQTLLWISFIILAFESTSPIHVYWSFFGFYIVKGMLDWGVGEKLGSGYSYLFGPFLDLFYTVFVPVVVLVATASKKITWK